MKSSEFLVESGRMSSAAAAGARSRSSVMALSAVYVALYVGKAAAAASYNRPPAFIYATAQASSCLRRRSRWTAQRYSRCRERPVLLSTMVLEEFNKAEIVNHLEHDYRADLALLATKFGTMIEEVDDIDEVHVAEIDGDHMSLEVVYCDKGEQTCVAVAVPIKFPYHCDNENSVIDAIHALEEMEDYEVSDEVMLPKNKISPDLMETIARICVVMNRDFQEELVSFVRAFGGNNEETPTGECEMVSLTPDGFMVKASMFPDEPVTVTFPRECLSAQDFQKQILATSKQAMMIL